MVAECFPGAEDGKRADGGKDLRRQNYNKDKNRGTLMGVFHKGSKGGRE